MFVQIKDWNMFQRMHTDWQNLFYRETESTFQLVTFKFSVGYYFEALKKEIMRIQGIGGIKWFRENYLPGLNAIEYIDIFDRLPEISRGQEMEQSEINTNQNRPVDMLPSG